ncbi:YecA family protein [Serratia sp. AKBS12]|uniref:YecA/YgfB family protein n=1 Tax=Serratia sp. AKBS12 TaxID=2974597 RepID=UPI0021656A0A|nr:YecA family protein [Serratia sp. AKBS12]MCS3407265.1 YecA family protein [Serratia sp. AKBS12]HEI8868491.1 YecA family protein [Serratia odorifera]
MSIQNTFPSYQSLTVALKGQSVALTAAEMHGLLSGMLCGGSRDASWQTLMHDLTNDGVAFPQALSLPLQQLYEITRETLEDDEFMFQLMMPDGEAVTVFERADALAGWVNHFLLGLGMMQPKLAQVKDEVGEAIDDLRNIAQLGYDEDEDQEELEQSLEEVVEYVRVAAILCHTEFSRRKPTAPENVKPTLH